jgi:hypothetical protein
VSKCGALKNPASDLVDKAKGFFAKWKEEKRKERKLREEKEYEQGPLKTIMNSLSRIFKLLFFVFIFFGMIGVYDEIKELLMDFID